MGKRKGEEAPAPDGDQAYCPYYVTHPDPNKAAKKKGSPSRRGSADSSSSRQAPLVPLQPSPFSPLGSFRNAANTMDRHYRVQPFQKWMDMTRYNCFVLNGTKFRCDSFVFVANQAYQEEQKRVGKKLKKQKKMKVASEDQTDDKADAAAPVEQPEKEGLEKGWVARILEVRAKSVTEVFARVYWMYWPEELPEGTRQGTHTINGRQSYHGKKELIASNHMDVINVLSVLEEATVHQWDETNEDEVQEDFYWRQAFDAPSGELSSAQNRCKCERPENPDKGLIGCTNDACKTWLHKECVIDEALSKIFERLGTDKPYEPLPLKVEEDSLSQQQPLSPKESGPASTAQHSIDVKMEDSKTNVKILADASLSSTTTTTPSGPSKPNKKARGKKEAPKPYEGLFEAVIKDSDSLAILEVKDLRANVPGGVKEWTESISCLVCDHRVN